MLLDESYEEHLKVRTALGIPPLALSRSQTQTLIEKILQNKDQATCAPLLKMLAERVPPGVDEAAKIKADFLEKIASSTLQHPVFLPEDATRMLGTMAGGYNIKPLILLLKNEKLQHIAADCLKNTLLIFDSFNEIAALAKENNQAAQSVIESWANAEWFKNKPAIVDNQNMVVFRVSGEINTDDLSPAPDAFSRPDIPLHALAMFKNPREGLTPDEPGVKGPLTQIAELKKKGLPLVFVGDVVGTGSSRKSATNSLLWHIGSDIPFVPNKRAGGVCLGGKIAPIFFNTLEDAGALPVEIDVSNLKMGDEIQLQVDVQKSTVNVKKNSKILASALLKTPVLLDEVKAGGRIPLIIGRALTAKARSFLGLGESDVFQQNNKSNAAFAKGFTLAQKIVGKACGLKGVLPGDYVEPKITTVGSQDTTGPMTRDELKDLACLKFSADLVMQSFCHTAAYPKAVDIQTQETLPKFFVRRGGVAIRPMDGVIHSWLNRLILPDTVGTGGDSHTRFPIGISFPAGSGLVAFAAATASMPLDMPESVLVRFVGSWENAQKRGITLRDLVNAIPFYAIKNKLLTVEKANKINVFSGRILEIEGLPDLKIEQAFELTDASAERSSAAATVALNRESVAEYLQSNAALIRSLIQNGYQSAQTLERRLKAIEEWLENGELLKADHNAHYAAVLEIPLDEINEPILACPNDPDDVKLLSEVAGDKIDEVFIGSCMTNIGHFRAAAAVLNGVSDIPARLWLAPPTRMDEKQLRREGIYSILGKVGARMEVPGCSLCMGNQAQIKKGSTAVSTSTRNFPNRLGINTRVYLASAELSAVCALLGKIPTLQEYQNAIGKINAAECYRYLNFHQMPMADF